MALAVGSGAVIVLPVVAPRADGAALRRVTRLVVAGHGWGPGIGMGQWGDFGYATKYHFGYQAILNHYYGTSPLELLAALQKATNPTISVAIVENMNLMTNVGYDPVVTSAGAFTVTSAGSSPVTTTSTSTTTTITSTTTTSTPSTTTITPVTTTTVLPTTTAPFSSTTTTPTPPTTVAPTPVTVPSTTGSFTVAAGQAVDLALQANGTWNAYLGTSCTTARQAVVAAAPVAQSLVNPTVSPGTTTPGSSSALLTLCRHDGVDETLHGQIQANDRSGYERTVNLVSLQTYLDGVVPAEESASWGTFGGMTGAPQGQPWGFQALEAQAVAARSYVLAYGAAGGWNGYATICDNTNCQAYVGASYESPVSNLAVADTLGLVLETAGAQSVVSARYSASTGGWTAPGSFPAVRDRGDSCVVPGNALECNPNHSWQRVFSGAAISRHYRLVGTLLRVRVISRNGLGNYGGRVLSVVIAGTKARITVTGSAFAAALNLRSDWFAISGVKKTRIVG